MGFNIPNFPEQQLACHGLVVSAKNTSESMQKFVQWMLTGFGAGLTFLLGNLDRIQPHIAFQHIKMAGTLFLWAAALGVCQRYLAMLIRTGTGAFLDSEKHVAQNIDIARYFIIYISNLSPSVRCAGAWAAMNFLRGNITDTGKWLFFATYVQCFLGAALTLLLLWALGVIMLNIGIPSP
jgi:hypothetical protein